MTTLYADLHTHTTCSDGLLSPQELVGKAINEGFRALAITDHDTMEGYRIAKQVTPPTGLQLVPGIELSCQENGRDVHILAYYLDSENEQLRAHEELSRTDRDRRGRDMVDRLRKAGVSVTYEELIAEAAGAPITRPHLAAILVRKGHATNMSDAFDKWLERGRVGFSDRQRFTVRDAVNIVRAAGGITIVAHPGRVYQDPRLFLALLTLGIDGIEVYHPSHWQVTREYYRMLTIQHHLLVSGGSDFHGSRDYDEQNFGKFGVTEEMLDILHTKAVQRRLHGAA